MGMSKFPKCRRFSEQIFFIECGQNREALCAGHRFVIMSICDAGVS